MDENHKVIGPPEWYLERLEKIRKLPRPTIEQVKSQFAAAAKFRRDNARCPKHTEYKCEIPPIIDCYHCWSAYFDKHQTDESRELFWKAMDDFDGLKD